MADQRKQPKPILKKGCKENKTHLVWDEGNLEETSKDRGTRMKIDEPDTPYHYDYSISDESEEDDKPVSASKEPNLPAHTTASVVSEKWQELSSKLETAQKMQEQGIELVVNPEEEENRKKQDFLARRKAHYNEGKKWRETKNKQKKAIARDEDEEDEQQSSGKTDTTQVEPSAKRQKT